MCVYLLLQNIWDFKGFRYIDYVYTWYPNGCWWIISVEYLYCYDSESSSCTESIVLTAPPLHFQIINSPAAHGGRSCPWGGYTNRIVFNITKRFTVKMWDAWVKDLRKALAKGTTTNDLGVGLEEIKKKIISEALLREKKKLYGRGSREKINSFPKFPPAPPDHWWSSPKRIQTDRLLKYGPILDLFY